MTTTTKALLLIAAALIAWSYFAPYDDTDNEQTRTRSGLVLRTDHGTGCQYLVAAGLFARSITPRLDSDGQHVCN